MSSTTRSQTPLTLWQCWGLFCLGLAISSLPFLAAIPRQLDRFLFGVGACVVAGAVMALAFPEMRHPPRRGQIPFRSTGRTIAGFALAFGLFLLIVGIAVLARAHGWWR